MFMRTEDVAGPLVYEPPVVKTVERVVEKVVEVPVPTPSELPDTISVAGVTYTRTE